MIVKGINDYDVTNYKKASMFIAFPHCSFKCEKECGMKICQNSPLVLSSDIEVSIDELVRRYQTLSLTHSIVLGGLEPFDDFKCLIHLVNAFRQVTNDDIVIYTGYNAIEITDLIDQLTQYPNIIIKYGRYIPNQPAHFDDVLGIELASPNQYAKRIS